jgi:hypothetical protein
MEYTINYKIIGD